MTSPADPTPIVCAHCTGDLIPDPRGTISAWRRPDGEPCDPSKPGHTPATPTSRRVVFVRADGEVIPTWRTTGPGAAREAAALSEVSETLTTGRYEVLDD